MLSFVWKPRHLKCDYFISFIFWKSHKSSLNIRFSLKTTSLSAIFMLNISTPRHFKCTWYTVQKCLHWCKLVFARRGVGLATPSSSNTLRWTETLLGTKESFYFCLTSNAHVCYHWFYDIPNFWDIHHFNIIMFNITCLNVLIFRYFTFQISKLYLQHAVLNKFNLLCLNFCV